MHIIGVDKIHRHAYRDVIQQPGCRIDVERSANDYKGIDTTERIDGITHARYSLAEAHNKGAQLGTVGSQVAKGRSLSGDGKFTT